MTVRVTRRFPDPLLLGPAHLSFFAGDKHHRLVFILCPRPRVSELLMAFLPSAFTTCVAVSFDGTVVADPDRVQFSDLGFLEPWSLTCELQLFQVTGMAGLCDPWLTCHVRLPESSCSPFSAVFGQDRVQVRSSVERLDHADVAQRGSCVRSSLSGAIPNAREA